MIKEAMTVAKGKRENIKRMESQYMDHYEMKMERMKRRKKRFIRRFSLVSLVLLLGFVFLFTYHMKQRATYAETEEKYKELAKEMALHEDAEKELLEEIELLNDEEYILDIARSSYFLSKKGEIIFQIDKDS